VRLRRAATTLNLSARRPFRSGRFSGTVVSTLRLHLSRAEGERIDADADDPPDRRPQRIRRAVDVHAVYRVTGLTGKLTASFRGLDAPLCGPVDACGVSGAASWAILSSGGAVVIDAGAFARRSDAGLRGALAAVRRRGGRGSLDVRVELRHAAGTSSTSVERGGGASCHDTRGVVAPHVFTDTGSGLGAEIALGVPEDTDGPRNLLRTGCPGPTQSGVTGRRSIAVGWLPLRALARRRLALPLRAGHRFDDGGYRGAWRGTFTLGLERVKEHVRYHFVRVPR
jgi:hypothetical protein